MFHEMCLIFYCIFSFTPFPHVPKNILLIDHVYSLCLRKTVLENNNMAKCSGTEIWLFFSVAPSSFKIIWISEMERSEIS